MVFTPICDSVYRRGVLCPWEGVSVRETPNTVKSGRYASPLLECILVICDTPFKLLRYRSVFISSLSNTCLATQHTPNYVFSIYLLLQQSRALASTCDVCCRPLERTGMCSYPSSSSTWTVVFFGRLSMAVHKNLQIRQLWVTLSLQNDLPLPASNHGKITR